MNRTGRFASGWPLIAAVVLSVIFAALSCENAPVLPEDTTDGGPLTPLDENPTTGDGPTDPDEQGTTDPPDEEVPAPKVIASVFRGNYTTSYFPANGYLFNVGAEWTQCTTSSETLWRGPFYTGEILPLYSTTGAVIGQWAYIYVTDTDDDDTNDVKAGVAATGSIATYSGLFCLGWEAIGELVPVIQGLAPILSMSGYQVPDFSPIYLIDIPSWSPSFRAIQTGS